MRGRGVTSHLACQLTLVTSTVLVTLPDATSAMTKPSKLLLLTYSVLESLLVTNTRILSGNVMVLMILRVLTSEIVITLLLGDMKTVLPSALKFKLCEFMLSGASSLPMNLPVAASTSYQ